MISAGIAAAVVAIAVLSPTWAGSQEPDVVFRALQDELQRTMQSLALQDLEKPYFVSYRVVESRHVTVNATFGTVLSRDDESRRLLVVELRVGSPDFDNSNFALPPNFADFQFADRFRGSVSLPLDDNYTELRRHIWLATDAAYKRALRQIAAKRAALQNKTRAEEIPEFSHEEVTRDRKQATRSVFALEGAERLVVRLSALFREMPDIFHSSVSCRGEDVRILYVNSEGSSVERVEPSVRLSVQASTQAGDGMPLQDELRVYGRVLDDLPHADELARQIRALGERLSSLRHAEILERYNGPVLFEPTAAAQLLAWDFLPALLARRKPVAGGMRGTDDTSDFQDRIGARVLPTFMSVTDDPTRATAEGVELVGGYRVDDEGVTARETKVIERGFLKTLLSGRTPVPGVTRSSANWRESGVCPSQIFIEIDQGLSQEELRRKLLQLVQDRGGEFGIVVRSLSERRGPRAGPPVPTFLSAAGSGSDGTPVVAAYKVYPDGREVLLRNVEISGFNADSCKEIAAAGRERSVYTTEFRPVMPTFDFFRRPMRLPLVALVAPALLFEELTLKKPSGEIPKLPAVKHPAF